MPRTFLDVTLEDSDFHRQVDLASVSHVECGRDPECDLQIGHRSLSRRHLRLERTARGWQVQDLGSSNGTRVNGVRLTNPAPLSHGDVITAGVVRMIFHGPRRASEAPSSYHYLDEPAEVSRRRPAVEPNACQDETATSQIRKPPRSEEDTIDGYESAEGEWDL